MLASWARALWHGRFAAPSPPRCCLLSLLPVSHPPRQRQLHIPPRCSQRAVLGTRYVTCASSSANTVALVVLLALVAMAAEGAPDTAAAVAKPTTAELNARPGRTLTERAHEAERRIVQKYNEHNASVADRFPKTGKTLTERAADAERKIAARYAVANDANAHNFPKTGKSLMERAAEAEKKRRENKAVTYGKKPE